MAAIQPLGTLALIGAGEYLERSRAVDTYLLSLVDVGDRPVKVVCLPTAASTEGNAVIRRWSTMGELWFRSLGCEATAVPVLDRASADDPALAAQIREADLIYLSGGKPTHLFDTLVDTAASNALADVVGRGGVLAGCSAGAMVQGSRIGGFGRSSAGLGWFPGVMVFPHFDEFRRPVSDLVRRTVGRGSIVVGVDGGTGLVHHDGSYRAVGEGRVHVWSPVGEGVFRDEDVPASLFATRP